MLPEIGHFSLILALNLCVLLSVFPFIGSVKGDVVLMSLARPLTVGIFVFVALAYVSLTAAFATDDFSVLYVAEHSNTLLPERYKLTAVWGGHEGSFLLWIFMLSGWMLAVAHFSRSVPLDFLARVLSILGMLCVGYLLFLLATSNPFDRVVPLAPSDGADLNSALQDFGFIVHPPTLYMGYVGFSVVFAFAMAALLSGRLDSAWARWCRPWANVAWAILTLGLCLGSWWAYYELGWGGWWAWDPVENPPLITWLLGTALVHSLAVSEKRGAFKSWTVMLSILAFAGSLLGTFITRSGLLTSIHAFASDPERGIFILGILVLSVGGGLLLYAVRSPLLKGGVGFELSSREMFLLTNNVLLVVAAASVLLGTLFPMIFQALTGKLISIGPPYFNAIFIPLMIPLIFFMAVGPLSMWKSTSVRSMVTRLGRVAMISLVLGIGLPLVITLEFDFWSIAGVGFALWISLSMISDFGNKIRKKSNIVEGVRGLSLSYYGMQLAHIGVAVMVAGISLTSSYSIEKSVLLQSGESTDLGEFNFEIGAARSVSGKNFSGQEVSINVSKDDIFLTELLPQRRVYFASGTPSTEMAIDAGFLRDLFVTLGEQKENGAWSMTLYVKPFVRWIWLGALFMVFGGLVSAADKRYRYLQESVDKNKKSLATYSSGKTADVGV
ncbi:MAG: heme lyase CcmF/NrfE family subunit [Gammaproteobacteria bacterium]|nr:heme lyase CcmF/NrfE family subunit [Gammaproteobacteria bacterium]MDG2118573.1 heme lyase CcmF/NrfE family subunit [Gammaproteobacteria bacterium]